MVYVIITNMHDNFILYNMLASYGVASRLNFKISRPSKFVEWTENNFEYVKYNPRKDINRYGLSITSLDGGLTGIPDLDSLNEYNAESNTNYEETDFNVLTDVYHKSEDLQKLVDPWKEDIFRTHILKINPGGYFPPHRDYRGTLFDSFRLIVSLKNQCKFIIEERPINFIDGSMYFIDTAKEHTLFNVHDQPSYWIVFNVQLNEKTVKKVTENFSVR